VVDADERALRVAAKRGRRPDDLDVDVGGVDDVGTVRRQRPREVLVVDAETSRVGREKRG
jgi:hypothetical protein